MKTRYLPWILAIFLMIITGCSLSGKGESTSLTDPTQGLASLPAYRASLVFSFAGTQAGEPINWSKNYTLTSIQDPETRLMTYSEIPDPEWAVYPALEGFQEGVVYTKDSSTSACSAVYREGDYDLTWMVEPAQKLPVPASIESAGETEMIDGIETLKYSFTASDVTDKPSAEGNGYVWLAKEGNYIVKYFLEITGGTEFFQNETSGTILWEYQLELIDPASGEILPWDCPIPLPEIPTLGDASDVQEYPGYLSYITSSPVQEVTDFYLDRLIVDGFTQEGDLARDDISASLDFSKDDYLITISIEMVEGTRVTITGQRLSLITSAPTPEAIPTVSGADPQVRVLNAIDKLVGSGSTMPAFASYHMEYSISAPVWSGGGIIQSTQQISANVEGTNVHFIDVSSGTRSEVYIIDDQEYEVVGGSATPGLGLASLTWSMWYIDPVMIISIGSMNTILTGTDILEGRTVEVYELSGSSADDTSGYMSSLGVNLTRVDATLWVDQETGGLIKAIIDYDEDVKDDSGTVKGNAAGHIEIEITRIGGVTVELP